MLDYQAVVDRNMKFRELIAGLTVADLAAETNEMVDAMLALIAPCTDAGVVFVPVDPDAHDAAAADEAAQGISWTLGHVVVHTTASSEESAALAAEMARGVVREGRSRWEVPWETVTTIAQCQQRLEESRRMRLASLQMWPDVPELAYTKQAWPNGPEVNAVGRFMLGLLHDFDHLGQLRKIMVQVEEAGLVA
jgi:hypothetical protein